jgi:hypothetical protein
MTINASRVPILFRLCCLVAIRNAFKRFENGAVTRVNRRIFRHARPAATVWQPLRHLLTLTVFFS